MDYSVAASASFACSDQYVGHQCPQQVQRLYDAVVAQ